MSSYKYASACFLVVLSFLMLSPLSYAHSTDHLLARFKGARLN
jgi:hypothetical protein